jgi:polyhydroxybutyrate depolymerase
MAPPSTDSPTGWVPHNVEVTGVDPAFVTANPPTGATFTWAHRNYYVKLPACYSVTKCYPVVIGGSGCGGTENVGMEGGYSVLGVTGTQAEAIQISMSYVTSAKVAGLSGNCNGFADDFTNSPEPAYIHAMIADIEAKYCVDKSRIFLSGYSSGAWQSTLSGCTNSDELRAYGLQIGGGLRLTRPMCKTHPVAAMYVVGTLDTANPIGPTTAINDDSHGSAPSRDDILMRNGCQGTATAVWDAAYPLCMKYTGCPEKYPVVWCPVPAGHDIKSAGADVVRYLYAGLWKFYFTLPSP